MNQQDQARSYVQQRGDIFQDFKQRLLILARELGFNGTNSVTVPSIAGPGNGTFQCPKRDITVSEADPAIVHTGATAAWFQPSTMTVYLSGTGIWEPVTGYDAIWWS